MTHDIFTPADLRKIEIASEEAGLDLMQRASLFVATWVKEHYPVGSALWVVAGVGNNGGDALWAAYHLKQAGYSVYLFVPNAPQSALTQAAFKAALSVGCVLLRSFLKAPEPALVMDGLFGIGLSRQLDEKTQIVIARINALKKPTLALDVPSGLDAWRGVTYGAAIRATTTITFLSAKPGLHMSQGVGLAGDVIVDELGLPATLQPKPAGSLARIHTEALIRDDNTHKGDYGSVCVVGGASTMVGAALLASRAALKSGAGKVYVVPFCPFLYDPLTPDLMIQSEAFLGSVNDPVYVVGPGLSTSLQAKKILFKVFQQKGSTVVDADALNLLAQDTAIFKVFQKSSNRFILTPHPKEAALLLKTTTQAIQADRILAAQTLAKTFNATVILKGAGTISAKPDGFFMVNTTGNAALSIAGQGDVLSGLCGALLSQGMPCFEAAVLAAYVHGKVADDWVKNKGGKIGLTASETIALIPETLNALIKKPVAESGY